MSLERNFQSIYLALIYYTRFWFCYYIYNSKCIFVDYQCSIQTLITNISVNYVNNVHCVDRKSPPACTAIYSEELPASFVQTDRVRFPQHITNGLPYTFWSIRNFEHKSTSSRSRSVGIEPVHRSMQGALWRVQLT